jgi:hypothetical protein
MSQGETPVKTVRYSALLAVWGTGLAQGGEIGPALNQSQAGLTKMPLGIDSRVEFTAYRL